MGQHKKPGHSYSLQTSLTRAEHEKIIKEYRNTTCRSLAEFVRDRLRRKPETVFYRNKSADEFLPIAISLRNELLVVGKQFRDVITTLQHARDDQAFDSALHELEAKFFAFELKAEEIKMRLNQIYELWWQK